MSADVVHLLTVENEPADARMVQDAFPEVQIYHAFNGRGALDSLGQTEPGRPHPRPLSILLDLNMPLLSAHHFQRPAGSALQSEGVRSFLPTADRVRHNWPSDELPACGAPVRPSTSVELWALVKGFGECWQGAVTRPATAGRRPRLKFTSREKK